MNGYCLATSEPKQTYGFDLPRGQSTIETSQKTYLSFVEGHARDVEGFRDSACGNDGSRRRWSRIDEAFFGTAVHHSIAALDARWLQLFQS